jgi:hypothetical protein
MLRAYGALPADSVRPDVPGEPEPVGSGKTERDPTIGSTIIERRSKRTSFIARLRRNGKG